MVLRGAIWSRMKILHGAFTDGTGACVFVACVLLAEPLCESNAESLCLLMMMMGWWLLCSLHIKAWSGRIVVTLSSPAVP